MQHIPSLPYISYFNGIYLDELSVANKYNEVFIVQLYSKTKFFLLHENISACYTVSKIVNLQSIECRMGEGAGYRTLNGVEINIVYV